MTQAAYHLLATLADACRAVGDAASVEELLQVAAEQAAVLTDSRQSLVSIADDTGTLRIRAQRGVDDVAASSFAEQLTTTRDERLIAILASMLGCAPRDALIVPLLALGRVTGLLAVGSPPGNEDAASAARENALTILATAIGGALESARLAAELRERRGLAETVERATGVGVITWNMITGVRTWSPEVYRLHGLDPGLPASHELWQATVHPDDFANMLADEPEAYARAHEHAPYTFREAEYRVRLPDGSVRWLGVRTHIVRDDHAQPIHMLGVSFEITERKRLDAALRESEQRLRLATEVLVGLLYEWDPASQRAVVFGGNWEMLGFRNDEVPENTEWWNSRMHPDDVAEATQNSVRAMEGDATYYVNEYRILHKDGHYVDVQDRGRIVRDAAGLVTRVLGGVADVSERRRHERERERFLAESERAMRFEHEARAAAEAAAHQRDHVLDVVAHELGNPLSTIGMCASALAAGCSPIEMRMAADLIERSVAWMHRMIRDLSDVASIETGRLALESRAEDPAVLIAAAVEMFAASARDAGVEPTMRAASNLPLVQADAGRVLQVLGNLLTNALRHTASGGRVAVSADVDRDLVRFTVDDTGTGITAEDLPHVFDRFWHKRDSAQRGSGLGLPIVRGIVEAHGGLVDVRSTPGEGSHFSFTIPVAR